eukprot:3468185-Alexandrium_andersonii.AAC.1
MRRKPVPLTPLRGAFYCQTLCQLPWRKGSRDNSSRTDRSTTPDDGSVKRARADTGLCTAAPCRSTALEGST